MAGISLETYDASGYQHLPNDWYALQWGSVYGEEGGGFSFCTFNLSRTPGVSYPDIGYGHELTIRKYLNTILFHGQIRNIEEVGGEQDEILITALGDIVITEDDELLRAFCDKRMNKWQPPSEKEGGYFQPGLFSASASPLGIYLHPNNGAEIADNCYTELVYEFFPGEVAERFRADLSLVLGAGVLMDAEVDAIDEVNGYIDYSGGNGDVNVTADMTVYNITQSKSATVSSINTGTDRITVVTASSITGWQAGDEIYVPGPTFSAVVDSISTDTITYTQDIGEANINNGDVLANLNKKAIATISSHDDVADTITVTDEDHIAGWEENDVLMQANASLFYATVQSVAADGDGTGTITWTAGTDTGASIVDDDVGWVLYNQTRDEFAWVDAWDVANRHVGADTWAEISAWTSGNVLRIYTPMVVTVMDGANNVLWPLGTDDVRISTMPHNRYRIDVSTTGSPTTLKIRVVNYVAGEYGETTFAQLSNVRAYSTEEEVTPDMLAKYVIGLLSAAGHDIDDSEDDVTVFKPFAAAIASVLGQVITYSGDTGESYVEAGDLLFNTDVGEHAEVVSIDTATNEITVHDSDDISGWGAAEAIEVRHLVEPMVFEFMTPRAALEWACNFGDGTGNPAAWGIRLDDRKRLYIESQDMTTVEYIVRRDTTVSANRGGTVQESFQQVRGVYQDSLGKMQVTDWQSDTDAYFASKYRRRSVRLDSIDSDGEAVSLITQFLSENKYPKARSSYTVTTGTVFTPSGLPVPVDELKATGGMVRIEDWRAASGARSATDLRDYWTTEKIAGVQVSYDEQTAELIPAEGKSTFELMLAQLSQMRGA